MSRKYKFHDKEGLYFVSFATVYWIDVFVRDQYFWEMAKSLDFCRKQKGMEYMHSASCQVMSFPWTVAHKNEIKLACKPHIKEIKK